MRLKCDFFHTRKCAQSDREILGVFENVKVDVNAVRTIAKRLVGQRFFCFIAKKARVCSVRFGTTIQP